MLVESVAAAAAPVALTSSANPAVAGAAVTFTATVTPAAAAGNVEFLDNGASLGTAPVSGGIAPFTIATLAAGAHAITATFSGQTSNALIQTVTPSASNVSIAASPNPAIAGQTVVLTAQVSPASASGSIQFMEGAQLLPLLPVSLNSLAGFRFHGSQVARSCWIAAESQNHLAPAVRGGGDAAALFGGSVANGLRSTFRDYVGHGRLVSARVWRRGHVRTAAGDTASGMALDSLRSAVRATDVERDAIARPPGIVHGAGAARGLGRAQPERPLPGNSRRIARRPPGDAANPLPLLRRRGDPRFSYVNNYLQRRFIAKTEFSPAADDAPGPSTRRDFFERFVDIFEAQLTRIEDRIAHSYLLTRPEAAPANALDWLGSWVGLSATGYPPGRHAAALAANFPLNCTANGELVEGVTHAIDIATNGLCRRGAVIVVEDFRLRHLFATILGADLDTADDPLLPGYSSSSNSFVGGTLFLGDPRDQAEALALFAAPDSTAEEHAVERFYDSMANRMTVFIHNQVETVDVKLVELHCCSTKKARAT